MKSTITAMALGLLTCTAFSGSQAETIYLTAGRMIDPAGG
jgi:hypothetical protein